MSSLTATALVLGLIIGFSSSVVYLHVHVLVHPAPSYYFPEAQVPASLAPKQGQAYRQLKSLTHREMMALPSSFDPLLHNYTVVIGAWRRPQYLRQLLEAFQEQTLAPSEIWVSVFASPKKSEYLVELGKHWFDNRSSVPVRSIFGEPQLGYWGRFQLALQVPTTHVLIADDDIRPSPEMMRRLMHMSHTRDYRGIYGFKGFHPGDMQKLWIHPERIMLANLVGGFWFMPREWVKLMFREDPVSWLTGEDFHLSHMARKHQGLPSWIYPHDPAEARTHAIRSFQEYMEWSNAGDTTLYMPDGRMTVRERIERVIRGQGWWD